MKYNGTFALLLLTGTVLIAASLPAGAFEGSNRTDRNFSQTQYITGQFSNLPNELTSLYTNRLITDDQYTMELAKVNNLQLQESVDLQQSHGNLTWQQRRMYDDQLAAIDREIHAMPLTPSSPPMTY